MTAHLARMRPLYLVLVFVSVLIVVSASLARAQSARQSPSAAALEELLASLSPDQRQALAARLAAYQADAEAAARELAGLIPPSASAEHGVYLPLVIAEAIAADVVDGNPQADTDARLTRPEANPTVAALSEVNRDLLELSAGFEAALAEVLTPEQMALYRQATATDEATVEGTARADLDSVSAGGCFNAGQWTNYGYAYVKAAKTYAFIGAFNGTLGTVSPQIRDAHIFYNAAEAYGYEGMLFVSAASVLLTATDPSVQNVNGGTLFGVRGDAAVNTAQGLNADAVDLALEDYRNSGGRFVGGVPRGGNYFSYFAFAYGVIADAFLSGATARTPNCF